MINISIHRVECNGRGYAELHFLQIGKTYTEFTVNVDDQLTLMDLVLLKCNEVIKININIRYYYFDHSAIFSFPL